MRYHVWAYQRGMARDSDLYIEKALLDVFA